MNLNFSYAALVTALLFATFSTLLPSSPGYFGTFHAGILAALTLFGYEANASLAFAVTVHGIIWLSGTAIGLATFIIPKNLKVINRIIKFRLSCI